MEENYPVFEEILKRFGNKEKKAREE